MMALPTDKQQHSRQLSFLEFIDLLCGLIAVCGSGLYHMATGIFRGRSGATKYRLHVGRAMFRTLSSKLGWKQVQYDAYSVFLCDQLLTREISDTYFLQQISRMRISPNRKASNLTQSFWNTEVWGTGLVTKLQKTLWSISMVSLFKSRRLMNT